MAGKRRYGIVQIIAGIVLVACLVGLGAIGYIYWSQAHYYKGVADIARVEIAEDDLAAMTVDWDALRAENPDIVGWVVIPDTKVDYPVVQTGDNETYLNRSFSGSSSWATSGGCIFIDCANSPAFEDDCTVMYGHHMRDGSMFACLADYAEQEYFDGHRTIYVLTPAMNYELTAFACVLTTGDDEIVQTIFATPEDFAAYLNDKLGRSSVTQGEPVIAADAVEQAFMLVTCEYSQSDGRSCVFASVTDKAAPVS